MCSDLAVRVRGLNKCYHVYDKPHHRLLQMLTGKGRRFFREFWALKDIDLDIRKGETVGIIGCNGSGKSTLLQMICGTLTPTSGELQVNGRVAALLELGAGFNPEFSGRENVYLAASLYGLSPAQIDERFQAIAEFADIGEFLEQPVKTYSSGMYVRLAFAVVAHVDADILVVDEALSVGDAFFTQKCMRFIRTFCQTKSLIFVSHDSSSIISLCDRVLWLDRGEQRQTGPAKEVCEQYLNALFGALSEQPVDAQPQRKHIARLGQPELVWKDQRTDLVNASAFRNDLQVLRFAPDEAAFGGEQARVSSVVLTDSQGANLAWVVGGEQVTLSVVVDVACDLARPIVGFFVKDRLGQTLFGDNTYFSYQHQPLPAPAGSQLTARFEFYMPWLAKGDYVVQVAVAEGSQHEHRQLHWLHEALVIRSHHDPVATGIIGIPLSAISLSVA
ncbi:ABC transporter ATP-binding protein [Pseudomonas sp. SWRI51]|uniref:ABC transporter ATP-binding protein n=1 Tax=Pseudomonas sp. SWRI51 TaxID=2745491 RepID=UPI001647FD8F|nr:ABC transporter ATP-binding protein [Pseudomonas sp. SWRI51]MBC3411967.1 ABC transporter ATP-binding protein [Pseudomonas sp. SWRI51]